MTMVIVSIVLATFMIVAAVYAVYTSKLVVAILAAGVLSLTASVLYLLLAAPDVAMTEAAIGSGLSTIFFFYVFNKVRNGGENG